VSYWQGVLLGLVQGLTEFLPISSSGHLVVAEAAVGLRTPGVVVEVVLHVATLLAVTVVYWRRIAHLVSGGLRGDKTVWQDVGLLALASVPAGVTGYFLASLFEHAFDSLFAVGWDFLITGAILWSTRWVKRARSDRPTAVTAGVIGVAQAIAILPGISRSGATISAGLFRGLERDVAARFSFLLATPIIFGAGLFKLTARTYDRPSSNSFAALSIASFSASSRLFPCVRTMFPSVLSFLTTQWNDSPIW